MPRANVKDKRKQQLMEANMASIARRGLEETTIAHVSKGADMSRGIVNFYFRTKEKMMQETLAFLIEEVSSAWQLALQEAKEQKRTPREQVDAILRAICAPALSGVRKLSVWAAFMGHATTHSAYAKPMRAADEALIKMLSDYSDEATAKTVFAFWRGLRLNIALGVETAENMAERCLDILHKTPAHAHKEPHEPKAKKPKMPDVLPGQLNFADLLEA